jgi:flagellar export protein FliJ
MKSLATLIKLQKTRVDEQRQVLARLQEQLEIIENAIAELEISKTREQIAAQENPEARTTYGAFLKAAVQRGREMDKQRQIALAAVEVARDKLSELFEEQKRYEVAEADRIAAEIKEENRRETQELDEIGSVSFNRKNNN